MNRVVSHLELKAVDSEERILEGWATRPESDRVGDIVESKGATYRLPLPLLMDHDHRSAVGEVISATVTDAGIRFKAKIARVAEPGAIKDLCDSAWSAAKAGLRRAVSIGFRPLEMEPMTSGGMRFKSWEWYELSLVSVPACAGATIDQIKSIDRDLRAKARGGHRIVRLDKPIGKTTEHRTVHTGNRVSDAVAKAAAEVEADFDRLAELRTLGPAHAMALRSIAATAKTTDEQFRELQARIARLEGK